MENPEERCIFSNVSIENLFTNSWGVQIAGCSIQNLDFL